MGGSAKCDGGTGCIVIMVMMTVCTVCGYEQTNKKRHFSLAPARRPTTARSVKLENPFLCAVRNGFMARNVFRSSSSPPPQNAFD